MSDALRRAFAEHDIPWPLPSRAVNQLEQLRKAGHRGVFAGDLLDKPTTRELVKQGFADNGAHGKGSPSALGTVFINQRGRDALDALQR